MTAINLGTDDYSLQEAINTGHPIYAPTGVYHLYEPVLLDSKTVIKGDGMWRTYFLYHGIGDALAPRTPSAFTEWVQLESFSLIGDSVAGTRGIFMPSCRHWDLRHLQVSRFGHAAIQLHGQRTRNGQLNPGDTTYNNFTHVRLGQAKYPLILGGTSGSPRIRGGTANINTFTHLRVFSAGLDGILLAQGASNNFYGTSAVANGNDGIQVSWYGNHWHGLVAENNGGYGVRFSGVSETHDNDIFGLHNGGSNTLGLTNASGSNKVY